MAVSNRAGMHRFSWDLHYEPLTEEDPADGGDEAATGAVPHHTYPTVNAPWAPPGNYTVRLTVDGGTYTQPLTLRLDPRVRTSAAGLAQLNTLTRSLYETATSTHSAYAEARSLVAQLDKMSGADVAAFKTEVEAVAPAPAPPGRGRFGGRRGGGGNAPANLESASNALIAASMAMQAADVAPTAGQVAAAERARTQSRDALAKWNAIRTTGLAAFNAKRKAAGQAPIVLPK